jgi:hypothetical protein
MYFRWHPELDGRALSLRFCFEWARTPLPDPRMFWVPNAATQIKASVLYFRQWLYSVFGEGIDTEEKHRGMMAQYRSILQAFQKILDQDQFLMGSNPTLVDFGFAGPFFRHFSSDPTPRKVMQQHAPAVYEWIARLFNSRREKLAQYTVSMDWSAQRWGELLTLVQESRYMEYSRSNALAWKQGLAEFQFNECTLPTVHYRVWRRHRLQERFLELCRRDVASAQAVEQILREHGLWAPLFGAKTAARADLTGSDIPDLIPCEPEFHCTPPFCQKPLGAVVEGKWPMEPVLARYIKQVVVPSLAKWLGKVFATVFVLSSLAKMRGSTIGSLRIAIWICIFEAGRYLSK